MCFPVLNVKSLCQKCKFCFHYGRRLFQSNVTTLLSCSAGFYSLSGILISILFLPYFLSVTTIELISAIFIALGVKFAGYSGLMLSDVTTIFFVYLLMHFQNPVVIIKLIIFRLLEAYFIIHEWVRLSECKCMCDILSNF